MRIEGILLFLLFFYYLHNINKKKVSKLVVLHEEAENGNEMPDLSMPVQVVKMAADNLIKVSFINHRI